MTDRQRNDDGKILYTSDVHCAIDQGWGYGGIYAVKQGLAADYHVLLVDDGDAIQGEPIGLMTKGKAIVEIMNVTGYDIAIPGNHEFDYGLDTFLELAEAAEYPYIPSMTSFSMNCASESSGKVQRIHFWLSFVSSKAAAQRALSSTVQSWDCWLAKRMWNCRCLTRRCSTREKRLWKRSNGRTDHQWRRPNGAYTSTTGFRTSGCCSTPIGIAMFIDAIVVGKSVGFFNGIHAVPACHSLWTGIPVMVAGLFILAYTQYTCMIASLGCGSRDTLLVALAKRTGRVPIGAVSVALLSTATLAGWLLGGPVGTGTLIRAFGMGPVMQLAFTAVRFDATGIRHQRLKDSMNVMLAGWSTHAR